MLEGSIEKAQFAVLFLHGARSDAKKLRSLLNTKVLREKKYIGIFPSSPDSYWNDYREKSLSNNPSRDDASYLIRLVDYFKKKNSMLKNNFYIAGISNGGGMAIRLVCDYPGVFKGIIVVASKLSKSLKCKDYKPIKSYFYYGTDDYVSPHQGRDSGREGIPPFFYKGKTFSAKNSIKIWSNLNKCKSKQHLIIDEKDDGTIINKYIYNGCQRTLVYYEGVGGGHTWPNSNQHDSFILKLIVGSISKEIDIFKEFFSDV